RIKALSTRLAEAIIALSIVLFVFFIMLFFINKIFPSGSSLISPLKDSQGRIITDNYDSELFITSDGVDLALMETYGLAAILRNPKNTVKRKPSDGIAWQRVGGGTALFDKDAVQTFKQSSTEIFFDNENSLKMGENSLIIIRKMEKDVFRNVRHSQVIVVDGELRGKLSKKKGQALLVEVNTPGAVTQINGKKSSTDFSIKVNPDKSSTVAVYSGLAKIMVQGKTIVIEETESVTMSEGEIPSEPELLPDPVRLISPSHKEHFYYRDLPTKVLFKWDEIKNSNTYRLRLARDPEFNEVLADEIISQMSFEHGNLRQGDYYWYVNAMNEWAEGYSGEVRHIRITKDDIPPMIELVTTAKETMESDFLIKGKSEPGAKVYVDGNELKLTSKGEFEYKANLRKGANLFVVEAADRIGNVAYTTHMIYRTYKPGIE
ncbi:FecR domain-containing protein, partial [Candidatus Pacearchaeota archaeon]|nr:FecR domain-containing protein [Candidatus Pacearchaeota archaeon]